ncbi:MAG: FAD:protein FMN transferase [Xanthomonadales bacterium]|nr:FAD:protein FMN transferase [Xanthomonadales bacterium]
MRIPLRPVLLLALLLCGGCASAPPLAMLEGQTMGTTWQVKLVAPRDASLDALQAGIQGEVDRVVAQMSQWEADSDLGRFNRAAAGTWQELPPEFFTVLQHALALAADTGGAFDPTVGPLVDLWGFGPGGPGFVVPDEAAIEAARARVGWARLQLDPERRRVLQPGGVELDLSGIAKGFGTDQVARYLDAAGVRAYLVDISGELRARGKRPDGTPWQVAVEKPGTAAGEVANLDQVERVIALEDCAIATSGDYRHYFAADGEVYSHHIDPRTGRPVPHRIASVTTVARDTMSADSAGTAIMVLGPERGLEWARQRELAVLLILHDGEGFSERMSPAFAELVAP